MNSVACDSQVLICVFWVDNFEHKMEFELGAKERLVSGKEAVGDEWFLMEEASVSEWFPMGGVSVVVGIM